MSASHPTSHPSSEPKSRARLPERGCSLSGAAYTQSAWRGRSQRGLIAGVMIVSVKAVKAQRTGDAGTSRVTDQPTGE